MAKYMGPPPLPTVPPLPWNRVRLTPNSLHTCIRQRSRLTQTHSSVQSLNAEKCGRARNITNTQERQPSRLIL